MTVLLCLPALHRATSSRVDAATTGQPAGRPAAGRPAQPAPVAPASRLWPGAIAIRPSRVSTAVPAAPVVDAGLIGPAAVEGALGIPAMVLKAYRQAAGQLAVEQPACKLPWWLLAGIGHTESGHAESGRLYADGTTRGLILGPRLDGSIAGDAVIHDTDHGRYDGDPVYDRAVGPMQFIPSTWLRWGADGNHDGKRDPSNIFDATLAAGRYLCADGRDLSSTAGLTAAVLSYNHSQAYLATVLAWGFAYRDGASVLADSTLPVIRDVTKARPPISARPPRPVRMAARTAGGHPAASSSTSSSASQPGTSQPASSSAPAMSSAPPSCTSSAAPSSSAARTSAATTGTSGADSAAAQSAAASRSADGGSATSSAGLASSAADSSTGATARASLASSSAAVTTSSSPAGCTGQ